MNGLIGFIVTAVLLPAATANGDSSQNRNNPLRFFAGRTDGTSTVRVIMRKPFRSRSIGHGTIKSDGSLLLVQRVEDEGKPASERRWSIREVGPGRYSGTMSEAKGGVSIDQVGNRFRFRFRMKNNIAVEEWLIPLADDSVRSIMTARKFGMTVARSEGSIRKVPE
jgi:Protein of unknown function (DUF3833)